jgi:hypothetical protein
MMAVPLPELDEELLASAYHEAGHVVAAVARKRSTQIRDQVSVVGDDKSGGRMWIKGIGPLTPQTAVSLVVASTD